MNNNAKEYLTKARANLLNGDEGEAVGCYAVLATEDPSNGEAVFFGNYADYVGALSDYANEEGRLSDIKKAFVEIENCLESAVKSVASSEGTKGDKIAVLKKIADIYIPLPDYVITNKIVAASDIEGRVLCLYRFASYVETEFNSDTEAMKVAILPLKEAVKLQQKFYAYKYDGIKAEDTVARIKKVDPSYIMPQKAGCVTLG